MSLEMPAAEFHPSAMAGRIKLFQLSAPEIGSQCR